MAITVLQVVDTALGIAQLDSNFRPKARLYYNLSLREAVRDFDWPYFRRSAGNQNFLQGQTQYDLPEDYSRAETCYYISQNGQRGRQIKLLEPEMFDQLRVQDPSVIGVPRYGLIDRNNGKIVFECAPAEGGFYFTYFRKAAEIDISGGNDNDAPDFEDETFLIQKITQWFFDYADDERYDRKSAEISKKLRDAKINVYDTDDNSVIQLNTFKFVPGRRPTRGGGGSGQGTST
jgi:hypothetical protein